MAKQQTYAEHNDTELQNGAAEDVFTDEQEDGRKKTPLEALADAAVKTACRQLEQFITARAARFDEIRKSEDQYRGVKTKALRGRHNIPFDSVTARGFVDTLMSKIDESLDITFERAPGRQQDKKAAQKLSAVCEFERGPDQGKWDMKDLGAKKLSIFSGRGIYKKFSSREGMKFCDHFEVVDHWDFVTEVGGGGFLDQHLYKGQMNIFRSRTALISGSTGSKPYYDKRQLYRLFAASSDANFKKNQEIYRHKVSRASSMGIDFEQTAEIGSQMYRLTEWVMFFRGEWYHMVFDYDTGIWVHFQKLEEVFSVAKYIKGRGPWISWATNFDPFEFWSIAPMDSVRPIAYAMKKVLNLSLDNLEKRNWNMRAYDPNVFNPRDLLWKDQGLVKANIKSGGAIGNHIYHFETPDTTSITINLTDYLNNFLGEKTGITPAAQGKSDDEKATIYVGNVQQVADRLGLTNKMYEQAHVDIGVNFQYGLIDHMPERYAVKIIGNGGIEWNEELVRKELDQKFAIRIRGTLNEEKNNAVLTQRRANALMMIARDPELRQLANPSWRLKETLTIGGYDQEDIRVALDTNSDADDDTLSEAAAAIEEIISGRTPEKNRGATTGYVRKIIEYAYDTTLDKRTFDRLVAFAKLHVPIAEENAQRKLTQIVAQAGAASLLGGGTKAPGSMKSPLQQGAGGEIVESPSPSPGGAPAAGY